MATSIMASQTMSTKAKQRISAYHATLTWRRRTTPRTPLICPAAGVGLFLWLRPSQSAPLGVGMASRSRQPRPLFGQILKLPSRLFSRGWPGKLVNVVGMHLANASFPRRQIRSRLCPVQPAFFMRRVRCVRRLIWRPTLAFTVNLRHSVLQSFMSTRGTVQ